MEIRDLAKLGDMRVELLAQILAAQQGALAAQADQSAMLEHVRTLEKEVARLQAWESEKQRYKLKPFGPGSFAYALKESAQGDEPAHWICASCYEHGKKSILQATSRLEARRRIYRCFECNAEIQGSPH